MRISDWSSDVCSSDLGGDQLVVEDRAVRSDAFAMRQIFGELDRDRRIFEAEARRIASGHHRGARWRAGRVRGIGGGEIDAFECKRVDRKSTRLNSSH